MNDGEAATAVAERLLDPSVVVEAAPSSGVATLADGLPGTALLHARLAQVDPVFDQAARNHWDAAAREAASARYRGSGIYSALGGLTASLVLGSPYLPDPAVTATATERSVRWMSARAVELADAYNGAVHAGERGTAWHVYDVISGLAGIGRILLAALVDGRTSAEPGLHAALGAMTTMLTDRGGTRPGWWVETDHHPAVVADRLGPTGAADTGLAHGVCGPLAFLSIAQSAGFTISGQEAAIRDAVGWLRRWRADEDSWPSSVSGEELDRHAPGRAGRRTAWCYGTPGITRSLLLAARALDDDALVTAAHGDLARLSDQRRAWDAEGPTLCHGYAGILRCVTDINPVVAGHAAKGVLQGFDPARSFLFPHLEHATRFDNPGLLTGAAGVALALAEQAGLRAAEVRTPWDALLLIA